MRVLTVIFTFTMAFGIPLPSVWGNLSSSWQNNNDNRVPEDCQKDNLGFQINVTRSTAGDTIQSYCRQCSELCDYAKSVRIRCDLKETPCVCRCQQGQTFRTDIMKCVETFTECINIDTNSDGVFHIITTDDTSIEKEQTEQAVLATSLAPITIEFNHTYEEALDYYTTTTTFSTPQSIPSNSHNCEVVSSEFLDGIIWNSSLPVKPNVSQDNITQETEEQVTWNFDLDEDTIPSVRWTGSESEFKQLSGLLVRLRVRCVTIETEICAMVKVEGIKTYTIFWPSPSTAAPTKTTRTTMGDEPQFIVRIGTSDPSSATTPVYQAITSTAGNKTDVLTGLVANEELEVIVTGVCVGVAIIMCLWMTCFAIEKRVQTTRARGEGKTSSSRTYTYAVSSCRRNLMENYDMPMIKVAKPKDDDDSSSSEGQRKKKSESSSSSFRSNGDADAEAEDTTSPSSSEQRAETGSSTENTPKKKSSFKQPPSYLDLPTKPGREGFGTWRPVAKQGSLSPGYGPHPTGDGKLKGILKMTPHHKPTPILKNSILKKPKVDQHLKGLSPPFSRRFVRTGSKRNQPNEGGDYLELQTLNGTSSKGASPTKGEGRHISSFRHAVLSVKARKSARFKVDELDAEGSNKKDEKDGKKQVVITCEVHHVDETPNGRRESEDNEENVKCSELEPLTKETYAANQLKRNCFEMRWEDNDTAQTASV
ncbi:uncharacterized protein [Amphiura filiformis]|uniref:uncharacterized protein n=1 Tax=Amphiura filiformis TaxID=82378 RepID=UPI003B216BBC